MRAIPRSVWLMVLTLAMSGTIFALLVPIGRPPDEIAHLDLLYQVEGQGQYPAWDDATYTRGVVSLGLTDPASGFSRNAGISPPSSSGQTLEELGGTTETAALNQQSQHPPAYYSVMAAGLRVISWLGGDGLSAPRLVLLLRLANVLMIAPLPIVCHRLAERCGGGRHINLLAAFIPLAVPGLAAMSGAINNDNGLPVLAGVAVVGLVAIIRGESRAAPTLLTGVVIGVAMLVKASALVLLPSAVIAVLWARHRGSKRSIPWLGVRLLAPAIAIGGWWYIRNLLLYDALTPTIDRDRFRPEVAPAGFAADFWKWFRNFIDVSTESFWSRIGLLEVELPAWMIVACVLIAGAAIVSAVVIAPRGRDQIDRSMLVFLIFPFLATWALLALSSYRLYEQSGLSPFLHGRYLYISFAAFSVVVSVGVFRSLRRVGIAFGFVAVVAVVLSATTLFEAVSTFRKRDFGVLYEGTLVFAGEGVRGSVMAVIASVYVAAAVAMFVMVMKELAASSRRLVQSHDPAFGEDLADDSLNHGFKVDSNDQ